MILLFELEPGLTTLLHSSELSWTKKYFIKKYLRLVMKIDCVITEIDKKKEEWQYLIVLQKKIHSRLLKTNIL